MLVDNVKTIMERMGDSGKIFSVQFIKKDGSLRKMQCRLAKCTTVERQGGELKYDPDEFGLVSVYDVNKKGYRMVNTNTVLRLSGMGLVHNFE